MKKMIHRSLTVALPFIVLAFVAFNASEASAQIRCEPGDVILSINGRSIRNTNDFINLVNGSGSTMYFTLRDSRTGRILSLQTRLNSSGYRFGAYAANNGGDGVRITGIMANAAASRCYSGGASVRASGMSDREMNQINNRVRRGQYSGRTSNGTVWNATPVGSY